MKKSDFCLGKDDNIPICILYYYMYYYRVLVKLFSRQDKILYILDTTILILYRKLYINIVSIVVLNIEAIQYNIKFNLTISCSPNMLSHLLFRCLLIWLVQWWSDAIHCSSFLPKFFSYFENLYLRLN